MQGIKVFEASTKNVERRIYNLENYKPTVYIAKYIRSEFNARVVGFDKPTQLGEWCERNRVTDAITGGYFDRVNNRPLGEMWLDGAIVAHTPFSEHWHRTRGSLLTSTSGDININYRHILPQSPQSSLLQAGPILVNNGVNVIKTSVDPEGFSQTQAQHDSDLTDGLYPRAAIGISDRYIINIAVDGYNPECWGITLEDLAEIFIENGADFALNLDGGGSTSLIAGGQLINKPRTREYKYEMCRPIYNAVILQNKNGPL